MRNFMNFSEPVQKTFNDMDDFQCFSKVMYDTAVNHLHDNVTVDEANELIRQKMYTAIGVDETANRKELRKAIRRNRVAIFEIIEDTVENLLVSGWQDNPFFREFVDQRNLADGDTNIFEVDDNSILTVSKLAGGHHDIIRQRLGVGQTYSVTTEWLGVKVYAEFELFMAGRVDWAKFITKIYEAYDKYVNDALYTALMGAGSKLPNQPQFNKTGAVSTSTKSTIINLIEDVQAATGKEVVIIGTKSALSKLDDVTDISWISDAMKDERHNTGLLGVWEGTRTAEIKQVFAPNDTATKLVDDTKLLFMPVADNKFIKLVNEGDSQIAETTDGTVNMDGTVEYEFQTKMGIAVVVNMLFGVYTITA